MNKKPKKNITEKYFEFFQNNWIVFAVIDAVIAFVSNISVQKKLFVFEEFDFSRVLMIPMATAFLSLVTIFICKFTNLKKFKPAHRPQNSKKERENVRESLIEAFALLTTVSIIAFASMLVYLLVLYLT